METIKNTRLQYDQVVASCREVFSKKNHDYGTAWRILRPSSITDQIFIKARRIKSIEQKGVQLVDEGAAAEYTGIINYCVIALIQLALQGDETTPISEAGLMARYDQEVETTRTLMENKNHDYGEVWRDMRVSTFTDLILMKLLRTKQIEDNDGTTLISEGVDANFRDIINYAIFALIRSSENHEIHHSNQ